MVDTASRSTPKTSGRRPATVPPKPARDEVAAPIPAPRADAQPASPRIDVEQLGRQLLGTWADIRVAARDRAAKPDLQRIEGQPMAEHRERVLGQLKLLVEQGAVHKRVPEGARRPRRPRRQHRRVRGARARRPQPADQVGRAVGPLRRRGAAPRHRVPPPHVPARHHVAEGPGRVRHDRDGTRLGCRGDRHDRHLRRGEAAVRDQHAVPRRVEGLPRQRGAARHRRRGVRPAHHQGREPRRARVLRAAPQRQGRIPQGHRRRGRRPEGRAQRHRQRPAALHERARSAREPAEPLRLGRRGRHLLEPHREPRPPVLHDARHARAGPRLARRRRDLRRGHGADDRHHLRQPAPPVQRRERHRRGGAARLPAPPAPPAAEARDHVRADLRPRRVPREVRRGLLRQGRHRRRPPGPRDDRRRAQAAVHLARARDAAGGARGVRRRRLPRREPHGRTPPGPRRLRDVRGRQQRAAPARREAPAHRLLEAVRQRGCRRDGAVRGLADRRPRLPRHRPPPPRPDDRRLRVDSRARSPSCATRRRSASSSPTASRR